MNLEQEFPDYRVKRTKCPLYSYIQLEKRCVKNPTKNTLGSELKNLALNDGAAP